MSERESYLIVGASGAIGSAVVRSLVAPGRSFALHYCTNRTRAAAVLDEVTRGGAEGKLFQSALHTEAECVELVRQAETSCGKLAGVALCGGTIGSWVEWQEIAPEQWQHIFFEHCIAPFMIARAALAGMAREGRGRIVYLSSISPKYGGSAQTLHYAAAKAALETAMHGLARQNAKAGVRINGVRAGFIDTPLQRQGRSPGQLAERISKIPVGYAGTPEDVAAAIAFLIAGDADFIHDEIFTVAGGD